jgi:hypothetical protein
MQAIIDDLMKYIYSIRKNINRKKNIFCVPVVVECQKKNVLLMAHELSAVYISSFVTL